MKKIIIAVLGLIVAGFFLRACFAGAEGQIRKQLTTLEELVSYEAGEGDLAALGKVKRLGGLFTEDVEIRLAGIKGARTVNGRKQVQQAAMAARSQAGSLEASLHDITVNVAEDKRSATAEATGRAKVSGERSSIVQDFVFGFEKTEEGWLIARVRTVEALR
ncbi:MAG TPA: nuclear transport factor 2 family protein [Opitutales bacterium]|nr:nuclear transport factor 2 family protein [Opitutales bacterium]